jgi:hypothetical protein
MGAVIPDGKYEFPSRVKAWPKKPPDANMDGCLSALSQHMDTECQLIQGARGLRCT